ncbi:hypothetical protein ACFH04_07450 [Streptomyces noboritoensis]|uniref:Uncharacterized protein n=1 Tax=Streptomyces noboritoensis TaxID=67337 RepID=A0ABV6TCP9_9ACTN
MSAYGGVPRAQVDELDTLQIPVARRYVPTRPASPLRPFILRRIHEPGSSSKPVTSAS